MDCSKTVAEADDVGKLRRELKERIDLLEREFGKVHSLLKILNLQRPVSERLSNLEDIKDKKLSLIRIKFYSEIRVVIDEFEAAVKRLPPGAVEGTVKQVASVSGQEVAESASGSRRTRGRAQRSKAEPASASKTEDKEPSDSSRNSTKAKRKKYLGTSGGQRVSIILPQPRETSAHLVGVGTSQAGHANEEIIPARVNGSTGKVEPDAEKAAKGDAAAPTKQNQGDSPEPSRGVEVPETPRRSARRKAPLQQN